MSTRITFAQHIYANLTTDQSPTRRRGYQTLLCTRSRLSAANMRLIEARCQHRSTQGPKSKWQFYGLPSGQVVISYLTSVPEPDEFGRTGRYVAHSIVIEPRDWDLIGATPFPFMVQDRFCQSMGQALAMGDLKSGEIATGTVDIDPYQTGRAVALSQQWSTEELWKLVRLVCHTRGILQRGSFVCFVGSGARLQEALEIALYFAAAPRINCAFDTSSAGCSWSREIKFWGQGFATEREARGSFVVLAEEKKVRLPGDWNPPETPNEKTLRTQLRNGTISTIPMNQTSLELMSAALTGELEKPVSPYSISEIVRRDFANANQEAINQRIDELLGKSIPQPLLGMVTDRVGRTTNERLDWLLKNPAGDGIGETLFEILGNWSEGPHADVKRALTPFIAKHPGLRLIFALWAQDKRLIQSSLSDMDTDQFKRSADKLSYRSYAKLSDFFAAKHLDQWFKTFAGRSKWSDVGEGISNVANYGTPNDCERLKVLSERLHSTEDKDLLLSWLDKQPFRKQVKSLMAALKQGERGESKSTLGNSVSWITKRIRGS